MSDHIKKYSKLLTDYERILVSNGSLENQTHKGASAIWLKTVLSTPENDKTTVYRPMGDSETRYLVENGILPDTQPYQAIIEGENGYEYAFKYLSGKKHTDTHPSTIVEFIAPVDLIRKLEKKQSKVEDGAISMGLGFAGGKGLPLFNESMKNGETTFRIVAVKRVIPK
jgi:hypothetical protein